MISLIVKGSRLRVTLVTAAMFAATTHLWTQTASIPAESSSVSQPPQALGVSQNTSVTVIEDTLIRVRTVQALKSKTADAGAPVSFIVSEDVKVGDELAIPRGAMVRGTVVRAKKSGILTGAPQLTLKLDSLKIGDRTYPLYTYQVRIIGTSKAGATEAKVTRGAAAGALVGAGTTLQSSPEMTGTARALNIVAGTTVGAGVGTAVAAATAGPGILIPAEAEVDFYLAAPITMTRVSEKEAARLSEGLHPGGPSLYVRSETP